MRRRPAPTPTQRIEAELRALRAENARLRRRLAAHEEHAETTTGRPRRAPGKRTADVRSMLRDRASRNP